MTHKFKKLAFLTLLMAAGTASFAQMKVGGAAGAADSSAYIQAGDATGANKGILNARVSLTSTSTWGLAGTTPRAGMMVYNTNAAITGTGANGTGMYYWDGTQNQWIWIKGAVAAGTDWLLNGNTNGTVKTLGTKDKYALPFITNNVERMRIDTSGYVGIGTTTPKSMFDLVSGQGISMHTDANGTSIGLNREAFTGSIFNSAQSAYQIQTTNDKLAFQVYKGSGANVNFSALVIDTMGSVGVNTSTPSLKGAKLAVGGTVQIADGTQGAGKVLTSDANGVASWSTARGGTTLGIISIPAQNIPAATTVPSGASYTITASGLYRVDLRFWAGITGATSPGTVACHVRLLVNGVVKDQYENYAYVGSPYSMTFSISLRPGITLNPGDVVSVDFREGLTTGSGLSFQTTYPWTTSQMVIVAE